MDSTKVLVSTLRIRPASNSTTSVIKVSNDILNKTSALRRQNDVRKQLIIIRIAYIIIANYANDIKIVSNKLNSYNSFNKKILNYKTFP